MHVCVVSPDRRYVDNLVKSLQQKQNQVTKMRAMAQTYLDRIAGHHAHLATAGPLRDRLLQQTKALQRQVEDALSAQYAAEGRRVNLIGDINSI